MLDVLDLFSGAGMISYGLERTKKFRTVAFCDINPFARRVIAKHWPDTPIFEDVKNVTQHSLRAAGVSAVDGITAGFPCQPVSIVGKRAGQSDERWLWAEVARLIRDLRPRFVLLENTTGLLSANRGEAIGEVFKDLASSGYDAEWQVLSSAAFGASHIRDRVWIVAYPNGIRREAPCVFNRAVSPPHRKPSCEGQEGDIIYRRGDGGGIWPTPDSGIWGVADEISEGLDRYGLIGNSVDPIVVEWIGEGIGAAKF